jgi:hypothetical protein
MGGLKYLKASSEHAFLKNPNKIREEEHNETDYFSVRRRSQGLT